MFVHEINDDSDPKVMDILRKGLSGLTGEYLLKNYSPDFENIDSNLFYILKNGRYIRGTYYVVELNGRYICSAGWNEYNENTALVLTRAYVTPEYRTTYIMGELLLPRMIDACYDYKNVWITCNENNKAIYNWFRRTSEGRKAALFNNWPEIYSRFEPIGIHNVYNTEQYVAQLRK